MCCSYSPAEIEGIYQNRQGTIGAHCNKMYDEFREVLIEMIDKTEGEYTRALTTVSSQTCRQLLEEAVRDEQGN